MLLSPRSLLSLTRPKSSTSSPPSSPSLQQQTQHQQSDSKTTTSTSDVAPVRPATTIFQNTQSLRHVGSKFDANVSVVSVRSVSSTSSSSSGSHESMAKRQSSREERDGFSPSSPPSTTAAVARPATPTSPVQIPGRHKKFEREAAYASKRYSAQPRRRPPRSVHSPDVLSPSVAALLAVTDIPRHRHGHARSRRDDKPLTVDEIVDGQHVSEKELSLSLSQSPMDMLLSPPDELDDDDVAASDSNVGSAMTGDSIPSMSDSFATDLVSSLETPAYQNMSSRRRRASPMRKSFEPVRSPSDAAEEHPLAADNFAVSDVSLDGFVHQAQEESQLPKSELLEPFKPLRSAFKSNLTASLRALRSAAKSFSSINFPSIPPDDFLTRSLLTIDPKVPYTDERRPPVTEEMPSAEVRRYLNPTITPRETVPPVPIVPGALPASIQMQTYKVHRANAPPTPKPAAQAAGTAGGSPHPHPMNVSGPPGMRQREMRENPDFIRIAVMEMAMRKRGKLDGQRPGRARWALPPRKMSARPYEVGSNGVPARWTSVTYG